MDSGFFSVMPRMDCPHVFPCSNNLEIDAAATCATCCETEVWKCLTCGFTGCSRFKNGHQAEHMAKSDKCAVALSYADGSYWCFRCTNREDGSEGSYIASPALAPITRAFHISKSGDDD